MSDIAIRVENLSKQYRIGGPRQQYKTLRESLVGALIGPFQRFRNPHSAIRNDQTIWALKDVSFEVKQGEVVGIIGRNGAGKSTLLKILSRITEPTEGRVLIHGRVGSLLEVGTGFHPELTGRENIYLNGAILGMKRAEIERRFDEIVAFAEIEKFLDTPVKRYSSGMYVRLAFAVAAHLEPEILLVDEVLAVGDAAFQKKCLGKMGDVAKEGRTVVFVSHNMTAIRVLCGRAILLEEGYLREDGAAVHVVNTYLDAGRADRAERIWDDLQKAPGNSLFRLHRVCVRSEDGQVTSQIGSHCAIDIETEYWNLCPGNKLGTTIVLYNQEGVCVLSSISNLETQWYGRAMPAGLFRSVCRTPSNFLNEGKFSVTVLLFADGYSSVHREDEAVQFEVYDTGEVRGGYSGGWSGVVRPRLEWTTEYLGV